MTDDPFGLLTAHAAAWGVLLDEGQVAQFRLYLTLLQEWNRRLNLTAIVDDESIVIRHFLDSVSCALVTGDLNGRRLIDIGSGAGFPGLPLKIVYPALDLTVVESVKKKTTFLTRVSAAMGLSGVKVIAERAEILGQDAAHREQYDWSVARGVAALPILAEYLLPLSRIGGSMLAMKGASASEEVVQAASALALLGGGSAHVQSVALPGREQTHALITISKERPTPLAYPRRPGRPAKRPL